MENKAEQRKTFILNAVYFGVLVALVALGAKYLIPWLLPFLIGYAIAFMFRPAVRIITGRIGLSERVAGCVVPLFAYVLLLLLLFWGGVRLAGIIRDMFEKLPDLYYDTLQPAIVSASSLFERIFGSLPPGMAKNSDDALNMFSQGLQDSLVTISGQVVSAMGSFTARIPSFFLAFFFSVMSSMIISMNYDLISGFLARQIPEKHRELLFAIRKGIGATAGNYLIACLKLMAVTFVEVAIGLSVLRVENAILLAAGIAVFDALPVFGVGGILLPWAVISLLNARIPLALGLLFLYLIVAVIRGLAEPRIIGAQLGLNPLVTLCVIYMGFKVMGVLGMILFPVLAHMVVSLQRAGLVKLWK